MTFSTWWDVLGLNALVLALAVLLDRLLPEPPLKNPPRGMDRAHREILEAPCPAEACVCLFIRLRHCCRGS